MAASRALLAFVLLLLPAATLAQTNEPTPPPAANASSDAESWRDVRFGATLESYYQFNANRPPDRISLLRAYDTRANTFAIQQATVLAELAPAPEEGRRFGMRLDLMFGQATETVQGGIANEPRPDVYRHIWQAYGSYVFPLGRGLRTDVGKFASNLGFETNYAKDNDHFSRAYLFHFLPFYHSGVRASLPVHDDVTLFYMLTNGIQQTEEFNDFKSNHVAAVITPAANVSWTLNYYAGQEQADNGAAAGPDGWFRVLDSYVTWTPTARLGLGLDVNRVTNEVDAGGPALTLAGLGVYARYAVAPRATVSMRYERLDDEGLFAGLDQVLQETTVTGEWRFADGFLARAEYRRDWSDTPYFTGRLGRIDPRRHQQTLSVGLVWWLGSKRGAW
jgi:hypothetical protein